MAEDDGVVKNCADGATEALAEGGVGGKGFGAKDFGREDGQAAQGGPVGFGKKAKVSAELLGEGPDLATAAGRAFGGGGGKAVQFGSVGGAPAAGVAVVYEWDRGVAGGGELGEELAADALDAGLGRAMRGVG
jgi:hypothetical protein